MPCFYFKMESELQITTTDHQDSFATIIPNRLAFDWVAARLDEVVTSNQTATITFNVDNTTSKMTGYNQAVFLETITEEGSEYEVSDDYVDDIDESSYDSGPTSKSCKKNELRPNVDPTSLAPENYDLPVTRRKEASKLPFKTFDNKKNHHSSDTKCICVLSEPTLPTHQYLLPSSPPDGCQSEECPETTFPEYCIPVQSIHDNEFIVLSTECTQPGLFWHLDPIRGHITYSEPPSLSPCGYPVPFVSLLPQLPQPYSPMKLTDDIQDSGGNHPPSIHPYSQSYLKNSPSESPHTNQQAHHSSLHPVDSSTNAEQRRQQISLPPFKIDMNDQLSTSMNLEESLDNVHTSDPTPYNHHKSNLPRTRLKSESNFSNRLISGFNRFLSGITKSLDKHTLSQSKEPQNCSNQDLPNSSLSLQSNYRDFEEPLPPPVQNRSSEPIVRRGRKTVRYALGPTKLTSSVSPESDVGDITPLNAVKRLGSDGDGENSERLTSTDRSTPTLGHTLRPLQRSPAVLGVSELLAKTDEELDNLFYETIGDQDSRTIQSTLPGSCQPERVKHLSIGQSEPSNTPIRRRYPNRDTSLEQQRYHGTYSYDSEGNVGGDDDECERRSFYDYGDEDDEYDVDDGLLTPPINFKDSNDSILGYSGGRNSQNRSTTPVGSWLGEPFSDTLLRLFSLEAQKYDSTATTAWKDDCNVYGADDYAVVDPSRRLSSIDNDDDDIDPISQHFEAYDLPFIDSDHVMDDSWYCKEIPVEFIVNAPKHRADLDEITLSSSNRTSWASSVQFEQVEIDHIRDSPTAVTRLPPSPSIKRRITNRPSLVTSQQQRPAKPRLISGGRQVKKSGTHIYAKRRRHDSPWISRLCRLCVGASSRV